MVLMKFLLHERTCVNLDRDVEDMGSSLAQPWSTRAVRLLVAKLNFSLSCYSANHLTSVSTAPDSNALSTMVDPVGLHAYRYNFWKLPKPKTLGKQGPVLRRGVISRAHMLQPNSLEAQF
jgi:hypothetical protein